MAPKSDDQFATITVMVVDDQDYVRSIVTQLLKRLGVGNILELSNGSDALELLNHQTPDLILCDIKMQPIDGLQFLREVRGGQGGKSCDVPIVFLTSASDRATVQAAMENAVDGYLVKPVSAEELRTKIKGILARNPADKGVAWDPEV